MLTRWRGLLVGFALILAVPLAHADDWADCTNPDSDLKIRGCTAVIDAGAETAANLAIAHNNRGMAYDQKGDVDRAIQDYGGAIARNPEYADAYTNRGIAFASKGDVDRALDDFNRAVALEPELWSSHYNRGTTYFDKGDLDRAIEDFDRAIAINPNNDFAYHNRGLTYARRGDLGRAVEDFNRAIAINPNNAVAHYNRGLAYAQKGDNDGAINDYDRAIALNPEDALAYYNRGKAHADKSDIDRAIRDFDRAIALSPNTVEFLNLRCWTLAVAGKNLEQARIDCDAALSLKNDPNIWDSRGLVGLKQGQFDKAWADYDAAVRANPETATFLYGRGIAALRLGRTAEGNADLAAATKLDGKISEEYARYGVGP